ncbi:MAG: hypothetical protein SFU56_10200 [Capsulimonadales bacterium]|nr:hypothetical protein [Capsulimonadales bacterium]
MATTVSKASDPSPPAVLSGPPIRVRTVGPRPIFSGRHQAAIHLMTLLLFIAGGPLVWIFGFTFRTLLGAATLAFGWDRGGSLLAALVRRFGGQTDPATTAGWSLDVAALSALVATWCCLYLALDHLAMIGNRKAQRRFLTRVELPDGPRFFVELRASPRETRDAGMPAPDVGFLVLTPDALFFAGERQEVLIPRNRLADEVTLRRSPGDLTGAHVRLRLAGTSAHVWLLARDQAARLSATLQDGRRLRAALRAWLDAPLPTEKDTVSPG